MMMLECSEPRASIEDCCIGQMNRQAAVDTSNGKINSERRGEAEWSDRTKSNNSLNASGNSLDVIRKIEGCSQFFPPR
jgi:hypothetical protein